MYEYYYIDEGFCREIVPSSREYNRRYLYTVILVYIV